jgi:2Fe-2S ferredoxin
MDEKTFAQLPEQNEEESEVIEFMEKVEATSRLACQITLTEALDGMTVTVAQEEGF